MTIMMIFVSILKNNECLIWISLATKGITLSALGLPGPMGREFMMLTLRGRFVNELANFNCRIRSYSWGIS